MLIQRKLLLEGQEHTILISDEQEALLAAQAAGRAVVGVERGPSWLERAGGTAEGGPHQMENAGATSSVHLSGIPYIVPDLSDVTDELLELVLRRHLGLPWLIGETARLTIRELTPEDAGGIPSEEYETEEAVFRSRKLLESYIRHQYGFYEYGTWALVLRETGQLIGLAGVSNPKLPPELEKRLAEVLDNQDDYPWLELGYHIFRPFRQLGYGREAVLAIASYTCEVLNARLCALIQKTNKASCALAKDLGMIPLAEKQSSTETDTQSLQGYLLYVQNFE